MRQTEIIPELSGYTIEKRTVSLIKANILAIVAFVLVLAIGLITCKLVHPNCDLEAFPRVGILFIVAIFLGVAVHEFIHGFTWMLITHSGWNHLRFGFMKGNPYCHIDVPMDKKGYVIGALMPLWLLGVIPWLIGVFAGSFPLILWGSIFIASAMGDVLIVWGIRHELATAKVYDHPSEAGCVVYKYEDKHIE